VRYVPLNVYTRAISFAEHILNNKKRLIFSLALIFALLTLGVSAFLITEAMREPGSVVTVSVDGKKIAEYPLSQNREYILNGGTNILVIENGKAYITYASCPDKVCMNQGKISLSGERIVCLPNKVMIEVLRDGDEIFSN
jgi:hypothetical protein